MRISLFVSGAKTFKLVNYKYLVANIIVLDCIALCPFRFRAKFSCCLLYQDKFAAKAISNHIISALWGRAQPWLNTTTKSNATTNQSVQFLPSKRPTRW